MRLLRTIRSPLVQSVRRASSAAGGGMVRRTALYDMHVKAGGTMVEYGGFTMPVLYKSQSIGDSVKWTRTKASLFDVGHMQQHQFQGDNVTSFLERLVPSDLTNLSEFHSTLSVLLTENGGIVDDLMITRISPTEFYIVTNAARRKEDIAHIKSHLPNDINHTLLDNNGLLALQGPSAPTVLQTLTTHKLEELKFGSAAYATVLGIPDVLVSRGGYTGEDGFEISVPGADQTRNIASAIMEKEEVKWAGLGARDSLRLEAGLCLYGHDLSEDISPVEAGLSWLVGKQRTGYLGEEHIKSQQANLKGIKRRVGFVVEGAPAREGAKILTEDKGEIGIVTSGGPSPTLEKNIAMGYIDASHRKSGTKVLIQVRTRNQPATVTKMPFIQTKYFK